MMKPQTITLVIAIATLSTAAAQQQQQQQYLRATIQDNIIPTNNKGNDGIIIESIDDEEPPLSINEEGSEGYSLIAQQFTTDPYASYDNIQMILNGQLKLAGIRYHPTSFAIDDNNVEYSEVYGDFCVYDTQINKSNPSFYPTIKDVMSTSNHCGEHRYSILLNEVMDAISNRGDEDKVKTLQPDGVVSFYSFCAHLMFVFIYSHVTFTPLPSPPTHNTTQIFHQGHSGAGLISNALSGAFDSTLVVSEHQALHSALSACDVIHNRYKSDNCSSSKQEKLIKDIITLLGRTDDMSVEHLFLKFESASTAYLSTIRKLYPTAKWTFSYRKAEETLSKSMERKRNVTCLKAKRNPTMALANKSSANNLDLEQLSSHEVCALHLSTLFEEAVKEHSVSGTGLLISYDDILESNTIIIEKVLPYLGLTVDTQETKDRVSDILKTRSNSRSSKKSGKAWDISDESEIEISQEVHDAVKKFMSGDWDGEEKKQV